MLFLYRQSMSLPIFSLSTETSNIKVIPQKASPDFLDALYARSHFQRPFRSESILASLCVCRWVGAWVSGGGGDGVGENKRYLNLSCEHVKKIIDFFYSYQAGKKIKASTNVFVTSFPLGLFIRCIETNIS